MKFLSVLIVPTLLISIPSCGNGTEDVDEGGEIHNNDTLPDADSLAKADSVVTGSYHISKEDSIKVADSVAHTKDPIRDFN